MGGRLQEHEHHASLFNERQTTVTLAADRAGGERSIFEDDGDGAGDNDRLRILNQIIELS